MTVPLSDAQLAAITAVVKAATPGPWRATEATDADVSVIRSEGARSEALGRVAADTDGEFIARARTDVPALLAEVGRLRAELASAAGSVARIQRWAAMTEHGSAAAEVLLLIRDLVDPDGEQLRTVYFHAAADVLDKIAATFDAFDDDRTAEEAEASRSCARALRIHVGPIARQGDGTTSQETKS